jgi:hypothetical protein
MVFSVREVAVALFSISNVVNGTLTKALSSLAKNPWYIALVPNNKARELHPNSQDDMTFVDRARQVRSGFSGGTLDNTFDTLYDKLPSTRSGPARLMLVQDLLSILRYKMVDIPSVSFEMDHPIFSKWLVITNINRYFYDDRFQTIYLTNTHYVRAIPQIIHNSHDLGREANRVVRYMSIRAFDPKATLFVGGGALGEVEYKGRKVKVEVSGHMLYMAISCYYQVSDFDAYLDAVRTNVLLTYRKEENQALLGSWLEARKQGILMEDGNEGDRLWHSFLDYKIAAYSIFYYTRMFGLPLPIINIRKLNKCINSLARRVPEWEFSDPHPRPIKIRKSIIV